MTAKAETQTIAFEHDLPHAPAKVWRALTEPELIAQWLMTTDMRPLVGQSFTFTSQPTPWWDGIVNCEVQEVDLHKRLRYSWKSGTPPSGLDTVVTWTLTPTSSGTHLRMEQTGFRTDQPQYYEGAKAGWPRFVASLEQVLARKD